MAGHFTGPSAGQYAAPKPPPEAHGAQAHLRENPAPLPNGQTHLVRHDSTTPAAAGLLSFTICFMGLPVKEDVRSGGRGLEIYCLDLSLNVLAHYIREKLPSEVYAQSSMFMKLR